MNRSMEVEVKVGLFMAIGTLLIAVSILLVGGNKAIFSTTVRFHTLFNQVDGIIPGAIVKVAGVRVGQVEKIKFDRDRGKVDVTFYVRKEYHEAIRQDSTVSVATQGMLGDRFIVVTPGNPALPEIAADGELKSELPKDFKDYLNTADEVLDRMKTSLVHLDAILAGFSRDSRAEIFFRNISATSSNLNGATTQLPKKMEDLYSSMGSMKSIMSKIDRGEGTIGALINDPSLYDDLKALLGGANRNKVLKYFVRKSVEDAREEAEKKK